MLYGVEELKAGVAPVTKKRRTQWNSRGIGTIYDPT